MGEKAVYVLVEPTFGEGKKCQSAITQFKAGERRSSRANIIQPVQQAGDVKTLEELVNHAEIRVWPHAAFKDKGIPRTAVGLFLILTA